MQGLLVLGLLQLAAQVLELPVEPARPGNDVDQGQQRLTRPQLAFAGVLLVQHHHALGEHLDELLQGGVIDPVADRAAQFLEVFVELVVAAVGGQGEARDGPAQGGLDVLELLFLLFELLQGVVVLVLPVGVAGIDFVVGHTG